MKNLSTANICTIIGMVSVIVMLVWGYAADDFGHSWLALIIGGMIIAIVKMVRNDNSDSGKHKEG